MSKQIETERLHLRPLQLSDANDVFEWTGDPVVNRFMPYNLYQNVEQVKEWISSIPEEENEFAFCLKDTGKVIGAGSICLDSGQDAYVLGYNLNQKFWRKGYATEAAKAMIDWAYRECGARDFVADHANENPASGSVMKKCGMTFDHYGQYSRFDGSETFDASFYKMHLD